MDRLRDVADAPFEPSTMRGTMSAQVTLGMPLKADLPPGSTNYAITLDATNFSADRMIMGHKVEAALLRASATPQGFQLKGDVKIAGTPASLEYRKTRGEAEAEIRLQGTLDEAARANLGLDPSNAVGGAVPVRLAGRLATTSDREGRFAIEADLTPAQIDGLLPGWAKPSGKPARATFTLVTKPQSTRIEDLLIEGAGGGVKGTIDFDGSGELQSANFPSYGFSDGDRASLKVERVPDGALRVVMRGEVYDGRGFVKSTAGGATPQSPSSKRHAVGCRPRHEARRRGRLQRRGVAQPRTEDVAPRRRNPQLRPQRQDRARRHADRRSARPRRRPPGGVSRRPPTPAPSSASPTFTRA